ncbi:GntR family transcriptional regulator [Alkalibacterium kapii]|uniref:GntR family transcriptional regulator n=1 Tax=Alkalibacterium kapii TaxID=426704 RepID=A0A511AUW6_9LACT|nr:GntR family transcriptional regulator [Alkalibacterium kapii]GEK91999.1 GntR family transcriptional regulator [Alkalibacterium kapii]
MKIPKYVQIKNTIFNEIQNKKYNDSIESERDLSKRLNASRMTVRKAIDELVKEGYLYREKNKGTFISDKSLWKKNTLVDDEQSENIEYRIVNFDIKYSSSQEVLNHLNIDDTDSSTIIRAIRLVLKDKRPQNIEEFYILRSYIDEKDINKFDKLLDLKTYLEDSTMTQRYIPMILDPKYAAALKLPIGTPIIMVEGTVKSKNGTPYIYYKSYNNPKEKVLEMTI